MSPIVSLYHNPNFYIAYRTTENWDYWTDNGKRVNFRISRTDYPALPDFTGVYVIIWVLCIGIFWRKK